MLVKWLLSSITQTSRAGKIQGMGKTRDIVVDD